MNVYNINHASKFLIVLFTCRTMKKELLKDNIILNNSIQILKKSMNILIY